ncbi:hypothetical protein VIRA109638_03705 [Vibrio rarus]
MSPLEIIWEGVLHMLTQKPGYLPEWFNELGISSSPKASGLLVVNDSIDDETFVIYSRKPPLCLRSLFMI